MASKCASHEAIKKNISMLSTSVLDLPCTVKEEPITDYVVIENIPDLRGACDTGWNMKNINVDIDEETVSSSLFAGIGEIKTEVKDEVTVEENIIEENSYTNPLNHDVNPVLIPDHSVAEEETICFIDVDTLKIDHLSCAKSFSNPLPSKEDLTVETVGKCGVESSSSPLDMLSMQPFSREGECPRKRPMLQKTVPENIPDLRGACDTGWNLKNINVDIDEETVSSSLFAGIGEMKTEVKDEVTVEENIIEENSYTNPLNHDVNPVLIPDHSIAEEGTICFIDVDTLKIDHLSCAKPFSNPLPSKEDLTVETVRKCGVESSSSPLDMLSMQPFSREGECPRKRPMLQKTVPIDWPDWAEQKLRSSLKQDKKRIKTVAVKLPRMRQQTQTTEQHILEVPLLKTLGERQFQTNSEQSWREVGMRYSPNVSAKLLAEEGEVKIKDPLNNRDIQKLESESESLTCSLCNEKFPDHMPQSKHVLSCIRTKPYSCYMCGMSFHGLLSRVSHVMTHHRMEGEHVCHQCGKLFPQMKDLENHRAIYCGIDFVKYPCSVCNEEFGDMSSQIRHSMKHINESEQCLEGLQHSNMLLLCSPKKGVKDPLLLDQELIQNPSKTHPLQNNVMLRFLCKVCGKVFKNLDFLDKHQQTEHSLYVCYVCSSRYHCERSWLEHIKHQHYSLLISYPCPKCNQSFTSLPEAVLHEKYHIQ